MGISSFVIAVTHVWVCLNTTLLSGCMQANTQNRVFSRTIFSKKLGRSRTCDRPVVRAAQPLERLAVQAQVGSLGPFGIAGDRRSGRRLGFEARPAVDVPLVIDDANVDPVRVLEEPERDQAGADFGLIPILADRFGRGSGGSSSGRENESSGDNALHGNLPGLCALNNSYQRLGDLPILMLYT